MPFNLAGYQYAAEGNAYCGIATYDSTSSFYREVLCAELDQPLYAGQMAYASMKVSPGGFGSGLLGPTPGFTCKGVGMRFSMGPLTWPQSYPNDAVIFLDSVLVDTAAWTVVTGSFIPDSNYTHVLIGNFFNDSWSSPERLDPNGDLNGYAFIDQVCVSHQAGICDEATMIPEQGIQETSVYPNPFGAELMLRFPLALGERVHIEVIDLSGRTCYRQTLTPGSGQIHLDLSQLANGYYMLRMVARGNEYNPTLLLKSSP